MRCVRCGFELTDGGRFCPECGADQTSGTTMATAAPTLCPSCSSPISVDMRFCQHCGAPLRNVAPPSEPAGTDAAPGAPMAVPAGPEPPVPLPASPERGSEGRKHGGIIAAIIAAIVAVALVAAGIMWAVHRTHDDSQQPAAVSSATSKPKKTQRQSGKQAAVDCSTTPDASLSGVTGSGSTLIATVDFSARACGDKAWKGKNVKITIKSGDNDVLASAVYDFTSTPLRFKNGETTAKLAYATGQYWRAPDQIQARSATMVVQKDSQPNGSASADVNGAKGGTKIADSDVERYAQLALSWQLDHDRSAVSSLYDTPTTQLSSKKYGMTADGKTWKYNDIYAQYLQLRAKWPKTVMAWAADYDYYTRNGYASDFYVILSGETFGSKEEGRAWCSDNGFGANDCMAIEMD